MDRVLLAILVAGAVFFAATAADKYIETQRREYLGMRSEGIGRRAVYFDRLTGQILIGPEIEAY